MSDPHKDVLDDSGRLLARFIRLVEIPEETTFFTPPEVGMQVGVVVHSAGHTIGSHIHRLLKEPPPDRCELLLVWRGRCSIIVMDAEGVHRASRELGKGDAVLLIAGGHGLTMTDDTVLVEVKQGPYEEHNEIVEHSHDVGSETG